MENHFVVFVLTTLRKERKSLRNIIKMENYMVLGLFGMRMDRKILKDFTKMEN